MLINEVTLLKLLRSVYTEPRAQPGGAKGAERLPLARSNLRKI